MCYFFVNLCGYPIFLAPFIDVQQLVSWGRLFSCGVFFGCAVMVFCFNTFSPSACWQTHGGLHCGLIHSTTSRVSLPGESSKFSVVLCILKGFHCDHFTSLPNYYLFPLMLKTFIYLVSFRRCISK